MSRYVILNTVDWQGCRSLGDGIPDEDEVMRRLTGCVWLFRVRDGVDDAGMAAREAIETYFRSDEGTDLLRREELEKVEWEEAMRWMPDEAWADFGLEPIRHPDVERVVLDAREALPIAGRDQPS